MKDDHNWECVTGMEADHIVMECANGNCHHCLSIEEYVERVMGLIAAGNQMQHAITNGTGRSAASKEWERQLEEMKRNGS